MAGAMRGPDLSRSDRVRRLREAVPRRHRKPCEHGPMGPDADGEVPTEDSTVGAEDEQGEDASGGFDRWRTESALGAVGTGIARGLQSVFAPRVDEIVIMASVPGDPPDADDRVRVILDPDDPTKSIAIVPDPPAKPSG